MVELSIHQEVWPAKDLGILSAAAKNLGSQALVRVVKESEPILTEITPEQILLEIGYANFYDFWGEVNEVARVYNDIA